MALNGNLPLFSSSRNPRKISGSFFIGFSPFQQSCSDQMRLLSLISSEFKAFIRQQRPYSVFKHLKIVCHFLIRKWAFHATRAWQTWMVDANYPCHQSRLRVPMSSQPVGFTDWMSSQPVRFTDWMSSQPVGFTDWISSQPVRFTDWMSSQPVGFTDWISSQPVRSTDWISSQPVGFTVQSACRIN